MKRKTDLNLEIVPESMVGKYDLPLLDGYFAETPRRMIPFNMAKGHADAEACVHFFIDDYQFERVWRSPRRYAELLKQFRCVCSPDFSLYTDMPMAMKVWNVYRSRLIGQLMQQAGIKVIPTLSWAEEETFDFCFDGLRPGGTVAVSTIGVKKDDAASTERVPASVVSFRWADCMKKILFPIFFR